MTIRYFNRKWRSFSKWRRTIKLRYFKMCHFSRNNGLSLAETASRSLTSLFSLTDRVSPRLRGFKVSSSSYYGLPVVSFCDQWLCCRSGAAQRPTSGDQRPAPRLGMTSSMTAGRCGFDNQWQMTMWSLLDEWISNCGDGACRSRHKQKVWIHNLHVFLCIKTKS